MNLRSSFAIAFTAVPALSAAQAPAASDAGGVAQVVLGLAVVLALIVGSLWLLKRLSAPRGAAGGLLKVITAVAVGPRERVVVVEVGDVWLILGVAPGQISALQQIPRQEIRSPTPSAATDFGVRLRQFMERNNSAR